jgi:predicted GNAT family N-acyltransferase
MEFSGTRLIKLTIDTIIKPFDCGDQDLNEFLLNDAINYQKELMAVTYLLESQDFTIAFFSLMNDKITIQEVANNKFWNRFRRNIPNAKRISSYPSVKIGRLAVNNQFKGLKFGNLIIDYIKGLFLENMTSACKYITVDAYNSSLDFYTKNGFRFLVDTAENENAKTRLMFFHLKTLK